MKKWLLATYGVISIAVVKWWQSIKTDISLLDIVTTLVVVGTITGCYYMFKIGLERDEK